MSLDRFANLVTTHEELTDLIGSPSELVIRKQLSELDGHMRSFIARSPFLLLGTVDSDGRCDVSPRGDTPAVAVVLDSRTLIIPEWKGNRRADSLRNIIDTGRVGLLLMTPGCGETLRINGQARVFRDDDLLAPCSSQGRCPELGIGVEIEECYFQCAKALLRSKLWEGDVSSTEDAALDFATILVEQTGIEGQTVESLRQQIDESYRERLY